MPQRKRTKKDLLSYIANTKRNGNVIVVANDFDGTVSHNGMSHGGNPFDTHLDELCAKALSDMEKLGVAIGAISNRAGGQIAVRYYKGGIQRPFIVGTYGLEVYHPSVEKPYRGRSVVIEHMNRYSEIITRLLKDVRLTLLDQIGKQNLNTEFVEVTIPSSNGPIYLENKCLSREYPEGFAQVYNFNRFRGQIRIDVVAELKKAFDAALKEYRRDHKETVENFIKVWGMVEKSPLSSDDEYSLEFAPLIKNEKADGMKALLRAVEVSHTYADQKIGLVMYAGDTNSDGEVMKANKMQESEEDAAAHTFGVWVRSAANQEVAEKYCDIEVNTVEEYGKLLHELAQYIAT